MPVQQVEKYTSGSYGVIGDLTFDSVVHIEQEGLTIINRYSSDVEFDLSAVKHCSSAALALLLSWVRAARAKGIRIIFKSPPPPLRLMVENANLQEVISLTA